MAIDRTVKFTVRLNMLNPAHVTINKVLNELNLDIFKSKNQFFIDAATYYIENYGQEELTQPHLFKFICVFHADLFHQIDHINIHQI